MNTIRSTWFGWGVLCVAGGGAYYFAKQQINADKQARWSAEMQKQARYQKIEDSMRQKEYASTTKAKKIRDAEASSQASKGLDHVGSPSSEISEDAAPVGHAPVDQEQRMREKSKYEAAEPYRSRKGDRFS